MPSDLPDYTKYITQNVTVPQSEQGPVIPRPKGGVLKKGSITTTATYQTVAEHAVTNGKTFQLAKIVVSCKEDVWVKIRWNGVDVSAEFLVMGKLSFTDWYPWDWYAMLGDGSKKIDIQIKYDTAAATVYAEIVGEEV